MGGRGSSSGVSASGKSYGTEYETLYQSGNIKFVRYNDSKSAKAPMETMTKGRVYATVSSENDVKFITYHDNENKRNKQIDLYVPHNGLSPHVHHGYLHNENDGKKGATRLTVKEKKMVDKVLKLWYNFISKQ